MKRILWMALPLAALLACASAAAQQPQSSFDKVTRHDPAPTTSVRGTVTSMSGSTLSIETNAGNRMEFEIDPDKALPTSVYTGSHVLVTYGPRETGVNRIVRVEPVSENSAVPAAAGVIGLPPHSAPAAAPSSSTVPAPGSAGTEPKVLEPAPMERTAPKRYVVPLVSVLLVAGAVTVWTLARRRA